MISVAKPWLICGYHSKHVFVVRRLFFVCVCGYHGFTMFCSSNFHKGCFC